MVSLRHERVHHACTVRYRGFMMLGIVVECIVKFAFSVAYCPLHRSPTDR